MRKKITLMLCSGLMLLGACKKSDLQTLPAASAPTAEQAMIANGATAYKVGTGTGNLIIDGDSFDFSTKHIIKIKEGAYGSINIINVAGTANQPILISNSGVVTVTQSMDISASNNIIISGANVVGTTYGIRFENIAYRALSIHGRIDGITLSNISFQHVADYAISGDSQNGSGLAYEGTAATRSENFKILNCLFDDAGSIVFGGSLNSDNSEDDGFFKTVEVAYNTFENTDWGTLCAFNNVQDYDVHHNIIKNINQTNNNHNGVFLMQGNGAFHDNKFTNYQGNSIRMWLYSRGSIPATVAIYNNVCYNTRKYGGFELQAFDRNIYPGKSTYANAVVYNNTVGKMNTSQDWEGQLLDLYSLNGGSLAYYNNLGFDLYKVQGPITDMINNMNTTPITVSYGNMYFLTHSQAVTDVTHFTSLYPGIGAAGF